jgi:hypothetical protein
MKKLFFSRKAILQAIRAACIALYFASLTPAKAQVLTGDGMGNVTASGFSANSYVLNPTSTPPLAASGTLTVDQGTVISAAGSSSSTIYAIEVGSPSTTTNSGVLVGGNSSGPAAGLYIPQLVVSGDLTVENTSSGTLAASATGSASALYVNETGMASGTGNITIMNDAGGKITSTSTGDAAYGVTAMAVGSNAINISNAGGINTTAEDSVAGEGYGINAASVDGTIDIMNSGSVTGTSTYGSANGATASATGMGNIHISNTGTFTGSAGNTSGSSTGINAAASGSGYVIVSNSGSGYIHTTGASATGINVSSSATGSSAYVSITNNALITVSAYNGNAIGIAGSASDSNSVTISNGGMLGSSSNSSAAVGTATGISATTVDGDISVTNTGTISPASYLQTTGIAATTTGNGNVLITNSGYIQNTMTGPGVNQVDIVSYGMDIQAAGTGSVTVNNSGAINTFSNYLSEGIYVNDTGTGAINITNAATGTITTSNGEYSAPSTGIEVLGSNSNNVTIGNAAPITVSGSSIEDGILSQIAGGTTSITNSGAISFINGVTKYGIQATGQGDITIMNNAGGTISNSSYGILANSSAGTAQVTNSAAITTNTAGNSQGISASGTSVTVSNYASISAYTNGGFNPSGPIAAILATASSGSVTINNSGSLNAVFSSSSSAYPLTYGIDASGPAAITVSNYSGGTIGNSSNTTDSPNYGIAAISSGGPVQVTNSAGITASATKQSSQGIYVSGTSVSVSNYGTISAYTSAFYYSIYSASAIQATASTGSITINNSGSLSASSSYSNYSLSPSYGIQAAGPSDITITNNAGGAINAFSAVNAYGIYANSSGGAVLVTNNAAISTTSVAGYADGIVASGASVTINNYSSVSAYASPTLPNGNEATAILASSTSDVTSLTVTNTGSLTASTGNSFSSFPSYGIHLTTPGTVINSGSIQAGSNGIALDQGGMVTNSGPITIMGGGIGIGIDAQGSEDVTVTNNAGGTITAPGSNVTAFGIVEFSTGGTAQVTNHAGITVSAYGDATGISATGTATIVNNTATISAYSSGGPPGPPGGTAAAITASSLSGPITVTNSGYLKATRNSGSSYSTYGILLQTPGTVTNSGNITSTDFAMSLPSGSSLTLQGAPVISGAIKGGADNSSTSLLAFDLTVPMAELAADQAELDSEITTYDDNGGGIMTFNIGTLSYDIEYFSATPGDITDDLMAEPTDTPEPATWLSILGGLAGLAFIRRRKNQPTPELAVK